MSPQSPVSDPSFPMPPAGLELAPGVRVPEGDVRFQFARSSGPGGQNVNKVNSKAEMWVSLAAIVGLSDAARQRLTKTAGRRLTSAGEIHLAADKERSQEANRAAVLERLREMIVQACHEPTPRRKIRLSRAAKRRRIESKRRRGKLKSDRRGGDES